LPPVQVSDRSKRCVTLEPLFEGSVQEDLIREQWDGLMRVTASLRNRHAAPDAVAQRLANASGADRLAKALTGIGKVDKTIFPPKSGSRRTPQRPSPCSRDHLQHSLLSKTAIGCRRFGQGRGTIDRGW
jgi:TnpA family transposase